MSDNNSEPQSQQEAWNRAQADRDRGLPAANTQNWSDAARQNYNGQYHGQNQQNPQNQGK